MKKKAVIIVKNTLTIMFGLAIFLGSCSKDKESVPDLTLDKNTVEVFTEENTMIQISGGDGTYSASSTSDAIAKPEISGKSLKVNGISKGEATITVKDGSGRTSTIKVTVKTAIVDATTPRFKWTSTIELDKVNGWGTAILGDRIAVTSLADKKQYIVTWTGGYTVGDKTNAKLRILESGKEATEVALTALEIQKSENSLYSIVFNKDAQKGELVIRK